MFQKVLQYAGEYRKKTYAAAVILLIAVFSNVLAYLFVYRIIEPLAAGRALSFREAAVPVAGAAVCLVLHACLYVKGLSVSHDAAYHTLYHLRVSLQKRLEAQPLGTIQDKGVGALKKIFTDDIETIELLLAHALPEGIANVSVPLFIFIAMFFVDWKLGLLALLALPIGAVAIVMMFRSGMSKMGDYYASSKNMNNTIIEYINGMEVVKVFNRDGESYHRFETDVKNYRDFTLSWFRACWPWMAAYTSVLPCIALFLLPFGSVLVLRGQSTLADLILVLCMSFGIGTALVRAVGFMSTMPQINYKINALEEALNAPPLCQGTEAFSGNGYSVSFENVHFSYGGDEVLHGISLEAREGGLTAFVGESGSGKSTLAKLLVHFYDVTEGTIRIGGQDIREMSLEALNEQIAFVAQEQFLFNISLKENIRLGKPGASDEEVLAAARKAQCMELFERLENGIDTVAGDGGRQLSGGERQRISLARAILKDVPVIVLDEAGASLDPENEEKMNRAIAELIKNKTVIVIAHRLRSIMDADRICVLSKGSLAAEGRHEELLQSCALYRTLWEASESSLSWHVSTAAGKEASV